MKKDTSFSHYNKIRGEDKAEITQALLPVLQMTSNLSNLTALKYMIVESGEEYVVGIFENGYKKKVNVSCDSGTSLIVDVLKALV